MSSYAKGTFRKACFLVCFRPTPTFDEWRVGLRGTEETMTDPFVGEVRMYSLPFAPQSWASCDGQQLQMNQNAALYSLLGRTFGGDGVNNFNLPDMRGRVPVGMATNSSTNTTGVAYNQGQTGGTETVVLTEVQMPTHNHGLMATTSAASQRNPTGNIYAAPATGTNIYAAPGQTTSPLHPKVMDNAGGGQPHPNMQPFLVVNFCIALNGVYPSRPW